MRRIAVSLFAASLLGTSLSAQSFQTTAPMAFMKDLSTNTILYSKAADEKMPPASMAKMMTVYVAFDLIAKGELKRDQLMRVRPETWKKWHGTAAGSTMFLSPDENVSVENLLHGIVTLSGNDACVVLAEGIAGTESEFAELMNRTAKKLGLTNSHFTNSTGWPDPAEHVSARDLAMIAEATLRHHPKLYKDFYGLPSFTWGKTMGKGEPITQGNRNPILGRVAGADGLKTGHTQEAGYGFTGSAEQNGRRLVMVLAGLTSMNERIAQSVAFMEWGFRAYDAVMVAPKGKLLARAAVEGGSEDFVGVTAAQDIRASVRKVDKTEMRTRIIYPKTLVAPIKKGQVVAQMVISVPGFSERRVPLVATEHVAAANFLVKGYKSLRNMIFGPPEPEPVK